MHLPRHRQRAPEPSICRAAACTRRRLDCQLRANPPPIRVLAVTAAVVIHLRIRCGAPRPLNPLDRLPHQQPRLRQRQLAPRQPQRQPSGAGPEIVWEWEASGTFKPYTDFDSAMIESAKAAGLAEKLVQDVNTQLMDDNYVSSDKIGTGNYFWAFPGSQGAQAKKQLDEVRCAASVETTPSPTPSPIPRRRRAA